MVHWGLTYEQFNAQPLALINRLYLMNLAKPFLPTNQWVQAGTIAAATYNVHSGKKGKTLSHEDIFPFLKNTVEADIMEGTDEESQLELHNKLNAIFG
ncbi:hypothetical protein F2P58_23455 [Vibrio fortis]|uniref:Uncharacterized protein n=2 Tax=Vibrio fortis TaxID=212667 RepID=A0A5N3QU24_9VIBR|nr:hypothetical protein F2P58_23455 [Vibrio fortis]